MDQITTKINQINQAIVNAIQRKSNLSPECYNVPALSSLNLRNLMNNLGGYAKRYLESGVHRGGLFCSTINNNHNLLSATAVDSFESDEVFTNETVEPEFMKNSAAFLCQETAFKMLKGDAFGVDLSQVLGPIDLFLYDAGHSRTDQRNALLYYKPVLDQIFVYCCDDWEFGEVKEGTIEGIQQGGYEVLYEVELKNPVPTDEHLNDWMWRGYGVFILKHGQK